jgi:hypothetical protein
LDKLRPVKTPWIKYVSIGSGSAMLILVLVLVVKPLITDKQETVVVPPKQDTIVLPPKQDTVVVPPKQDTVVVPPKQDTVVVPPKQDTVVVPPIQDTVVVPPKKETVLQFGTSSDGVIQLQTSKPEYKNGDSFQLSFILTRSSYVRVIDRDTKGKVTTLRPNPRQTDKLLPANKEQVFPPKGIDVPVHGEAGDGIVTVVASSQPFSAMELLNADGSVSEQVKNGSYSWVQVHYTLR